MATEEQVSAELVKMGFSESDSEALADCMLNGNSLSWQNSDPVTDEMLQLLNKFIELNNAKIEVKVKDVATRDKYLWDVRAKR
ncbi:hypothetical protein GF415_04865 [Candidatus Micrarchaeota archaeon]|nr:hypothetical protein [Candidatus Micrarchaeota archaeon]